MIPGDTIIRASKPNAPKQRLMVSGQTKRKVSVVENKLNLSTAATEVFFRIGGLGNGLGSNSFDDEVNDKYFCWCLVDFSVKNSFFCFDRESDEMLTFGELEHIRDCLSDLLSDQIEDVVSISFIEPDLEFRMHPKLDIRTVKKCVVREGLEIQDVYVEVIINLEAKQTGFVTFVPQTYSYPLDRSEILSMRDYLDKVILGLNQQWESAKT